MDPSLSDLHVSSSSLSSFSSQLFMTLSLRSYELVRQNWLWLIPLYPFQFLNGFGRMWAFFALINAFSTSVIGVKLEAYPLNWAKAKDIDPWTAGWYMVLAEIVATLAGVLTLTQGYVYRRTQTDLLERLLESDSQADILTNV